MGLLLFYKFRNNRSLSLTKSYQEISPKPTFNTVFYSWLKSKPFVTSGIFHLHLSPRIVPEIKFKAMKSRSRSLRTKTLLTTSKPRSLVTKRARFAAYVISTVRLLNWNAMLDGEKAQMYLRKKYYWNLRDSEIFQRKY